MIQSQLAQCVLTHVAVPRTVAIRRCDIANGYLALCDVSILRSQPRGDLADVLTNVPCAPSHVAGILTYESALLTDISLLLAHVTTLQPSISFLQSYLSPLLPYKPVILPCFAAVLADIACS